MSEAQTGDWAGAIRGLAPGLLVSFVKPPKQKGKPAVRGARTRFHLRAVGVADAAPDFLLMASELGLPGSRTTDEIISAVAERAGTSPDRLRRFVDALMNAGHLVSGAPPPRWTAPSTAIEERLPVSPSEHLRIPEGSSFLVDGGDFLWFDHGGALRLRLTFDEFIAIRPFGLPSTPDAAWTRLSRDLIPPALTRDAFDDLLVRMRSVGLMQFVDIVEEQRSSFDHVAKDPRRVIVEGVLEAVAAYEASEMSRPGDRIAVVPVNDDHKMTPLSLGLLLAYAQELDGERLRKRYDFVPLFLAEDDTLLEWTERPAIFLFSNYIWNIDRNIALSAMIKAANPANLMIHGGPSTPKYTGDCEAFFADNPSVDITVRGEGEASFAAILDALDPDMRDLSSLREVAGLSFRTPDGVVVHTADRERIADLNTIPSPYLLGMFEPFGRGHVGAVMESNRGCPYGCTFCDWGSATLSRIRQFDMERVKGELHFFVEHELMFLGLADANFGILERDVEIAQTIADLKKVYGYPKTAALNYAKNTMKHLRPIIDIFASAGLAIEPTVAVQTMDEPTLKIIRRSNIKTEKYDELANEFRKARLSLATDIMMGLPGSTLQTFKNDLQKCTDRDVRARANQTVLLPNSPMNDPSYREEHGIVAKAHEPIRESKSFTREEFDEMDRLRIAFYVFDNFGVLRHVARFVRSETGTKEVDFYHAISRINAEDARRWPLMAALVRMMSANMAPPCSWGLFVEEVEDYVVDRYGVERGSALDTVLKVQLAHLPAPTRVMPETLDLAHDYAAWLDASIDARAGGHLDDWERVTPRLHTYSSAEMKVSDPNDICRTMVGQPMMELAWSILAWDMASPVARAH